MLKERYLERIGYRGSVAPTPESLAALQEAHLRSVPFENLDIHLGVPIRLDPAELYAKVVDRRRGGFCYELNGLFHWLLGALGFAASMVSARVYDDARGGYGPEFDHMAILVDSGGGRQLVDVGFGAFSLRPLALAFGVPQDDPAGSFLLERAPGDRIRVSAYSGEQRKYLPQYDFTTAARRLQEFEEMCRYHQTSPESHFTRERICSMATPGGRITVSGDRLIITSGGRRTESSLPGEVDFRKTLRDRFGFAY